MSKLKDKNNMVTFCAQIRRIWTDFIFTNTNLILAMLLAAFTTGAEVLPQVTAPAKTDSSEHPPVSVENIEILPRLTITGTVGALFRIEYVDDLSKTTDWITLKNLVLPSSPYQFIDTNSPKTGKRFYRVTSDPRPPHLVWINPGTFTMGSPFMEDERLPDEGPQTTVTLSKGFWIGKCEVTQVDYLSVMGVNPSSFADDLTRPVDSVSWIDAKKYCEKLTDQERQAGRLPAGYVYRLPTEAEWEFAARAGTQTRFSYGDDPGYTKLDSYVWSGVNSAATTHAAETKLPNPWGLHDMHGNAWEWCSDWYENSFPGSSQVDPQGPLLGLGRVQRGGGYRGLNRFCRSASRGSSVPWLAVNYVGFRVVLAASRP